MEQIYFNPLTAYMSGRTAQAQVGTQNIDQLQALMKLQAEQAKIAQSVQLQQLGQAFMAGDAEAGNALAVLDPSYTQNLQKVMQGMSPQSVGPFKSTAFEAEKYNMLLGGDPNSPDWQVAFLDTYGKPWRSVTPTGELIEIPQQIPPALYQMAQSVGLVGAPGDVRMGGPAAPSRPTPAPQVTKVGGIKDERKMEDYGQLAEQRMAAPAQQVLRVKGLIDSIGGSVQAVRKNPSDKYAIADLLQAVAKIQDPSSAVMEGEIIRVQGDAGLQDSLNRLWTKAQRGTAITNEEIEQLYNSAINRAKATSAPYYDEAAEYRRNMDPDTARKYIPPILQDRSWMDNLGKKKPTNNPLSGKL